MARPKKGEQTLVASPALKAQLSSLISNLVTSGGTQWVARIRRRRPKLDKLWQFWKHTLSLDQVDDLAEYCYDEGGKEWEYWIQIYDLNGNPPVVDGKQMSDFRLPALEEVPAPDVTTKIPGFSEDPVLVSRQKQLHETRVQLEIERQEAELERQRRRLEKIRNGEDEDDDDDGDASQIPPGYMYHPQYGLIPAGPMGMGGYNPMLPPWMQGQRQEKSELATLLPIVMSGLEKIAEKVGGSGRAGSALDDFVKMKQAGLMPETLQPGDMLAMVAPLVAEMGKISASSSKVLMESIADTDRTFREKMLEMMVASGASDDDIDKWKKILGLVTDTAGQAIKLVWGRGSVAKGKDGVQVPVIAGKPQPPGLPAPKPSGDGAPKPSASDEAVRKNPAEEAKAVQRDRVRVFLLAKEQEMLVGSDAPWAADKLDDIWFALPLPLREKILGADVAKIYELLREYEPEVVDRILEAVKADKTEAYMKWCMDFWNMVKTPPEDDEPEEGEGPGEEGGPQEPEPDTGDAPEPEKKPEGEPAGAS